MLTDKPMHYCPGCAHGLVHKLVAEATEELGLMDNLIGVASVGCSVFSYDYFNCDMEQAAHGRAPAVATGIKRVHPDKAVFTYQGDGDLCKHRHGGNRTRGDARRNYYGYFHQQRHLRHDGRSDGAYHPLWDKRRPPAFTAETRKSTATPSMCARAAFLSYRSRLS